MLTPRSLVDAFPLLTDVRRLDRAYVCPNCGWAGCDVERVSLLGRLCPRCQGHVTLWMQQDRARGAEVDAELIAAAKAKRERRGKWLLLIKPKMPKVT